MGSPWTDAEHDILRSMVALGASNAEVADRLHRTPMSVAIRKHHLKLARTKAATVAPKRGYLARHLTPEDAAWLRGQAIRRDVPMAQVAADAVRAVRLAKTRETVIKGDVS